MYLKWEADNQEIEKVQVDADLKSKVGMSVESIWQVVPKNLRFIHML